MLKNLFLVASRNISRQKFFAVIHIIGLSLGLMVCVIIGLYAHNELQYDKFHKKAERIFRINQTFIWGQDDALFGSTGPAVVHAISAEVPEFEEMTRIHPTGAIIVTHNRDDAQPITFEEEKVLAVDGNFFDVFTFPLIAGNETSALRSPNAIILTKSMAHKYFPDESALGKYLELGELGDRQTYVVSGVTNDVPSASHIQFDFLISMSSLPMVADRRDSWMWTTFVTFGLMRADADPVAVANKVAAVPGKYLDGFLQKYRGMSYQEFLESGEQWNLYIQPLLDIHLSSKNVYSRLNETGNIRNIYILWIIGSLILGLSLINFMNLSTARATTRAKEVGIRKVIGSDRKQLIFQFLTESILYVVVSVVLALFMAELLLPLFNRTIGGDLSTTVMANPIAVMLVILFTLLIGTLGGLYPAFYLSSFRPASVLKGKIAQGLKGGRVRNILVTAQFAISIAMIACTLIVRDQVRYWMEYDLGFDRENKLIVESVHRLGNNLEAYKNNLLSLPVVDEVSYTSDTPPLIFDFDNFSRADEESLNISVNYLTTDEHFVDVMGLDLILGRNFSRSFNEQTNIIVNEQLIASFGFPSSEAALNKTITHGITEFKIIGVIKDFNTSLSDVPYPVALLDKSAPIFRNPSPKLVINLSKEIGGEETRLLLQQMRAHWDSHNVNTPFTYSFVNKEYEQVFAETIRFGQILSAFAGLAVCIACLGLVGLVAFVIEKRNKEIGIRKVLGASATNIWVLISGDFGKLLLLGSILAVPISWYLMSQWLENFALRTDISLVTLLSSGVIMVAVAIVTTSFQTLKASKVNPVEYLNEE